MNTRPSINRAAPAPAVHTTAVQRERAMSAQLSPEDVVRKFLRLLHQRPARRISDEVVAPRLSPTMAIRRPGAVLAERATITRTRFKQAGAVIGYTIDALVADGEMVAAAWTGTAARRRRDRQRAEPVPDLRRTCSARPGTP